MLDKQLKQPVVKVQSVPSTVHHWPAPLCLGLYVEVYISQPSPPSQLVTIFVWMLLIFHTCFILSDIFDSSFRSNSWPRLQACRHNAKHPEDSVCPATTPALNTPVHGGLLRRTPVCCHSWWFSLSSDFLGSCLCPCKQEGTVFGPSKLWCSTVRELGSGSLLRFHRFS